MKKATRLYFLLLILLAYPAWMALDVQTALDLNRDVLQTLRAYGVSMWIGWLIFVAAAVYYKWTEEKNRFFYFTYGYIVLAFGLYGYFYQQAILLTETSSQFSDSYTAGVFTGLLQIVVATIITAILQVSVWWFTRKLHRR